MQKKRLLKLAEHLETVDRRKFDLDNWKCGTIACACGHACDITSFKRLGLKLQICDSSNQHDLLFGEHENGEAVEIFFNLTQPEAEYLFFSSSYRNESRFKTPKAVAKRIRKFVVEGVRSCSR